MNKTKIEWTATPQPDGTLRPGYTSNPVKFREKATGKSVWGCVRKSPGCAHCYASELAKRYGRGGEFTEAELAGYDCYLDEAELRQTLSPRRLPAGSKVFVGDMTDVFGPWVPFEFLDRMFAVFALRPDVVFQVLTKRPERMREYVDGYPDYKDKWAAERVQKVMREMLPWEPGTSGSLGLPQKTYYWPGWPLPNVWLGTSAENQHWADIRLPQLLATPAAVRFVSYEPALGPVDFSRYLHDSDCWLARAGWEDEAEPAHQWWCICNEPREDHISWLIVGGESGRGARPFDVAWARSTVEQCRAAGVACFVKQLGRWAVDSHGLGPNWLDKSEPVRLKDRKGGDMAEWPADLRVREMPRC